MSKNNFSWKNLLLAFVSVVVVLVVFDFVIRKANSVHFRREYGKSHVVEQSELDFEKLIEDEKIGQGQPFVFIMGDSITFGFELPSYRYSYPFRIRQLIQDRAGPGEKIVVSTDALPGANTLNESYALTRLVMNNQQRDLNIEAVVLGYCLNDPMPQIKPGLSGLLFRAAEATRHVRGMDSIEFINNRYSDLEIVQNGFDNMQNIVDMKNVPLLVTIFPVIRNLENYSHQWIHDRVAEQAEARGFKILDLLPFFAEINEQALVARIDEESAIHPSILGHRIAADTIFVYMVYHNWLHDYEAAELVGNSELATAADVPAIMLSLELPDDSRMKIFKTEIFELIKQNRIYRWQRTENSVEYLLTPVSESSMFN